MISSSGDERREKDHAAFEQGSFGKGGERGRRRRERSNAQ
jgi:hypothetical protein